MKPLASKHIASTVLGLAGMFGVVVQANAQSVVITDARYVFSVTWWQGNVGKPAGCMIIGNSGLDEFPTLYDWGASGWCGLADSKTDMLNNRQAVWSIHSIVGSNGVRAHTIKSYVNGRCLIRAQNGTATFPSLYMWSLPGGDTRFCGFRSADELIQNGQAAWYFDGLQIGGSAWLQSAKIGTQPLGFGPIPTAFPVRWERIWASFPAGVPVGGAWEFNLYPMEP
jgi:hypothetical protein